MKKIKVLTLAAIATFAFASCNNVDSLINKYEKACKAGDTEEIAKIGQKLEDQKDKITDEQAKHLAEITLECVQAQTSNPTGDFDISTEDFDTEE